MTKEQEFRKQTEEAKFEAFSLMCKKVADLEKENAELKKKCYKKAVKDYCELEKENAELKAQKHISDCVEYCNTFKYACMQLTKAKEIIKNLMVYVPVDLKEYEDTKQFLSEVEK